MVKLLLKVCAKEDKTAVVVVASYRSVSRNSVRFKALFQNNPQNAALRNSTGQEYFEKGSAFLRKLQSGSM